MPDDLQMDDWTHIGDPNRGFCKRFCCALNNKNSYKVKRLLITTVYCYDENKWDLLKSIHQDELSAISSEIDDGGHVITPIRSGSLTPVSHRSIKNLPS